MIRHNATFRMGAAAQTAQEIMNNTGIKHLDPVNRMPSQFQITANQTLTGPIMFTGEEECQSPDRSVFKNN